MATEPFKPAAVGLQMFVAFAASVAGFTAGLLLTQGPSALLVAAFFCLALFLLARISADAEPSSARNLLLLAGWAFTVALLLLAVGGVLRPKRIRHDVAGALGAMMRLAASLVVSIVVPSAVIAAGLGRADSSQPVPIRPAGSTLPLALSGSALMVTMFLFALALLIRPLAGQVTALVALVVVWPAAMTLVGAFVHRAVLSRHRVDTPVTLRETLAELSERTRVSFGRVLCLDPEYGSGRVCLVIGVPGSPALAVSANLVQALAPDQLLAVLAHEAAHVHRHHLARKLVWMALLTVLAVGTAIALQMLVQPLFPARFRLVASFVALFPVLVGRTLYEALVSRRHEAEADRFAVRVAGADALLAGLELIQGTGPAPPVAHNRWTTHGTWDVRSARIRQFEKSEPGPAITSSR